MKLLTSIDIGGEWGPEAPRKTAERLSEIADRLESIASTVNALAECSDGETVQLQWVVTSVPGTRVLISSGTAS